MNILGDPLELLSPGIVEFQRDGTTIPGCSPRASRTADCGSSSADATSGTESYRSARFLYTDPPRAGRVVLDFNRAYNPPCAYNPFTTCPLPPPENRMTIPVRAGERAYETSH